MQSLKAEYSSRSEDFNKLLSFLEKLESTSLYAGNDQGGTRVNIDFSVINSIKSTLILMIYNLIEYTVRTSVEIIEYDFLGHDFEKFTDEFQTLFLKTFCIYIEDLSYEQIRKKIKDDNLIGEMMNCFVEYGYFDENMSLNKKCKIKARNGDGNPLGINGNVTYRTIQGLSLLFDFGITYTRQINGNIDILREIRRKRNNLAHGNISFNSGGRDLTLEQIKSYKINVDNFFNRYILLIENYIGNKPYLKNSC